ncbi:alpha/beta fold hydrolase, partial [Methylibium sp. T29-B]|uniref:alpha/beta fold hydrolase n=1 Tax=Methylibium sp. T29-B TaxID=1437443 RepID=UPI0018CBFA44
MLRRCCWWPCWRSRSRPGSPGASTPGRSARRRAPSNWRAPPAAGWTSATRGSTCRNGPPHRPALLLTHGTGAWSGTWFGLPDALAAAGWRVVAVDLPPFGLTTTPDDGRTVDYSRAAQARRLLALARTLGPDLTLVGHSFGAGPALEAAVAAAADSSGVVLRRLVLVDPALG